MLLVYTYFLMLSIVIILSLYFKYTFIDNELLDHYDELINQQKNVEKFSYDNQTAYIELLETKNKILTSYRVFVICIFVIALLFSFLLKGFTPLYIGVIKIGFFVTLGYCILFVIVFKKFLKSLGIVV